MQCILSSISMVPSTFSTLNSVNFTSSILINMNGTWWKIPVALA
jgi:hypothetical protein